MKNIIKINFKSEAFSFILLLVTFIASFYFYLKFPEQVPTHWGIDGQVDGWSNKFVGAFLFPGIILISYLLFLFLPMFDPRSERYEQFQKTYAIFKNIIIGFMVLIYFIASFSALGYDIPVGKIMTILVGLLFVVLGNYMGKLKSNWFVGIKTPWTLSSEDVWNRTHSFGGKIFVICGLIIMFMNWYPVCFRLYIFFAVIIALVFGNFAYSYYLFKKEKKDEKNNN